MIQVFGCDFRIFYICWTLYKHRLDLRLSPYCTTISTCAGPTTKTDRLRRSLQASHIYRDLRDLIWPRRRLFLWGLFLVFINRAAGLVLPGSTKFLIDDVVQKHREDLLVPLAAA